MLLLDKIRRSLSSEPARRPVSALFDEARDNAAIDRAIGAFEAMRVVLPSDPSRPPSEVHPPRRRQGSGAQSPPTDSQSTPADSQSPPRRARGGRKPSPRRKASKTPRTTPEQVLVGVRSHAPSAREHAMALLDYLLNTVGCPPGGEAMPATLEAVYRWDICEPRGWHPISWRGANGIGRHLRELCGGRKHNKDLPNADRELPDGRIEKSYSKRRIYVLPRWEDVLGLTGGPPAGGSGASAPSPSTVTPFPAGARKRRAA